MSLKTLTFYIFQDINSLQISTSLKTFTLLGILRISKLQLISVKSWTLYVSQDLDILRPSRAYYSTSLKIIILNVSEYLNILRLMRP